jgi:tetratricopeptide (TPR) repeat protein
LRRIVVGLAALAVLAGCSKSQTQQDTQLCDNPASTDDQWIAGCGAVIKAGGLSPASLSIAYGKRGFAYGRKGLVDQAIADETQAIALDPNYVDAYSERAADYSKKRQADHAIADFTHVLALNPSAMAYRDRGAAYLAKGQDDLAIADATQGIALTLMDPKLYQLRAMAYEHKGLKQKAIDDYRAALQLDPDDQAVRAGLTNLAPDEAQGSWWPKSPSGMSALNRIRTTDARASGATR